MDKGHKGLLVNIVLILFFSAGCSMLQKKLDPSQEYTTDSGFQFRFPMSGDWYPGQSQKGLYVVGQKPSSEGTSKITIVRHGPIYIPSDIPMTNKEILDRFKTNIENEAIGGRVSKVRSSFNQVKHNEADCLAFEQSGEDNTPSGAMNMSNQGLICLHPSRPYQFIWIAMSERWPLGKSGSASFSKDTKLLFDSLKFLNAKDK